MFPKAEFQRLRADRGEIASVLGQSGGFLKRWWRALVGLMTIVELLASCPWVKAQMFGGATNYAGLGSPFSIVAADVNGDAKIDLVIGTGGSDFRVFTNSGGGNFGLHAIYTTSFAGFLDAADFNGDGKVDLVTHFETGLAIWTNTGDGNFSRSGLYTGAGHASCIRAVDVNGDNAIDLVSCNGAVFTNEGNGTFALASSTGIAAQSSVTITDLNGDGAPDLVEDGLFSLIIFTNAGGGTFKPMVTNALPIFWPGTCCAADVNGDGKMDIVVPEYGSGNGTNILVLTNNGSGILGSNRMYTVTRGPWAVRAADVNGDGWVDLLCCGSVTNATVFTNAGTGHFAIGAILPGGDIGRDIIAADWDGDGRLDLALAIQAFHTVSVFFNQTTFSPAVSQPTITIGKTGRNAAVSWPLDAPGWCVEKSAGILGTEWGPAGYDGYPIVDSGTNRTLTIVPAASLQIFRLMHP